MNKEVYYLTGRKKLPYLKIHFRVINEQFCHKLSVLVIKKFIETFLLLERVNFDT